MKFIRIKSCCELLKVDCDQGRKCPNRPSCLYTIDTVGSDSHTPRRWLWAAMMTAVYAVSIVATTIVFAGFAGYFWGYL